MSKTLFIVVAHFDGSAFLRLTSLIVFLSHLYVRQLLCKCDYKYQDILDNQNNFVVNIEI